MTMEKTQTDVEKFDDRAPVKVENVAPAPDYLAMLIEKDAPMETLEKFMELQERHEANEARKAYVKAMAAFKSNPPEIIKNKHVSYSAKGGKTEYDHASLDHVAESVSKALSAHDLSFAWKTEQNGKIIVTCSITHEMGHSESTSLSADADTTGSKNPIQAIGSAITYLQRYTLLSLLGLAAKGQDDDGSATDLIPITDKQVSQLTDMILAVEADEDRFLKHMGVESLETIPASQFNRAMAALKAKMASIKAKGEK
jgi:hypothetical protein